MHKKLQENIDNNKVCSTCLNGTCLTSDPDVELCMPEGTMVPKLAPKIKTCFQYEPELDERY